MVLIDSPFLKHITWLNLAGIHIRDDTAAALRDRFGDSVWL
jgi:hypothetical protein